MRTHSYPDTIVIGRLVIYTQSSLIARTVEELVEQDGLADQSVSGVIYIDGTYVKWFALPSKALAGDTHFP